MNVIPMRQVAAHSAKKGGEMETVINAAIPRCCGSRRLILSNSRVRSRSIHQRISTRGALSSDRLQRQTREAVIKAIDRAPDQRVTPGDAAAASGLPLSDAEVRERKS